MNYNFTDRVRKVLAMAREEAVRLQIVPDRGCDEGPDPVRVVPLAALPDEGRGDVARDDAVAEVAMPRIVEERAGRVEVVAEAVNHVDVQIVRHPVRAVPLVEGLGHVRAHHPREARAGEGWKQVVLKDVSRLVALGVDAVLVDDMVAD